MKKVFAYICVAALGFTLISGCTSTNSSSGGKETPQPNPVGENTNPGSTPESSEIQYSAPFKDGKFDPPVSFTAVYPVGPAVTFKDGETIEDNVHLRWAKETLGIDIKYLWTASPQNQAFVTKLRLMLSSNEDLPDVMPIRGDVSQDLIDSGKVLEVGELFEKYAGQVWKDAMNEDPSVWYPYMRDGKKYGLPVLDYAQNQDHVLWIREDWLQKLKLEAPKTIDDLEKVMHAFTTQDPDGNGEDDTYGLTFAAKNGFTGNGGSASWIFGAYGDVPKIWNLQSDGTLAYGSIHPGMKDGLKKLNEWMDKGYIPKEVGLFTTQQASEGFNKGKVGIMSGPLWFDGPAGVGSVATNVPGAVVKPYPIPAGPDGKMGRNSAAGANGVVLLSKDMEHPDAFFAYWNYLYENYANPQTGGEFEFGFAKGYDWDIVDGVPTSDREKIPGGWVPADKYTLTFEGARIPSLQAKTYKKLAAGHAPETPFEKKISESVKKSWIEAGALVDEQFEISKPNKFNGAPTKTMKSKKEFLDTLELETFTKIMYGELPLDEFDKFVEKWKSSGGDEITKEVNDWYKSVSQ